MGQKTHPYGFRLGIIKPWRSRYFAGSDLPALLEEDGLIRRYLKARLAHAAISDVHIERKPGKVTITIFTGRPGVVIGKRGAEVDKLRDELAQLTTKEVGVNVEEIKRPELDAQLVAANVALRPERGLMIPRQLGPTSRVEDDLTSVFSCNSKAFPCSPNSPNPAVKIMTAGTLAAMHC